MHLRLVAPPGCSTRVRDRLVTDRAWSDCRGSWAYFVFLTLATMIAAVAVITDSSILVVEAMVVGMTVAGVLTLLVQRGLWGWVVRRRALSRPAPKPSRPPR